MTLEKMRKDLTRARQNAMQWQARAKDIEKRITETENQTIVRSVREIVATPEELDKVLAAIRAMKEPQAEKPQAGELQAEWPQAEEQQPERWETDKKEEAGNEE